MPHQKHVKINRHNRDNGHRADANNNNAQPQNNPIVGVQPAGGVAAPVVAARPRVQQGRLVKCCVPGACLYNEELIDLENLQKAVRVYCNSETCTLGTWMHKVCFDEWEQTVLAYLRSCGRARSWSEKQRLQNLWTKKGYDLAFKACDCNCGRGHIRKDLDYIPPLDNALRKQNKKKKQSTKPDLNTANSNVNPNNGRERRSSGNGNTTVNGNQFIQANVNTTTVKHDSNGNVNGNMDNANSVQRKSTPSISIINNNQMDLLTRVRANSVSSTGSSQSNTASSPASESGSPDAIPSCDTNLLRLSARPKFDFSDQVPVTQNSASIFRKRHDLSAFNFLPKHKQNPYHIKMEDDDVAENDDVRTFVLNHLSTYKTTSLNCVLCKNELSVFDSYPLIDGTLFLSPQAYEDQVLQVISEGRLQFINAVCVNCLEGQNDIRCAACKRKWNGSSLLLGSMYSYDIFAAMPCCQKRLTCKHCRRAVVDVTNGLQYFSEYSHMIPCPYCKAYDYHFIRPLPETFTVKVSGSIWN